MAKKYYQDKEDREHESMGMKKAMKSNRGSSDTHRSFVVGHDPSIGRDDIAGMPKETVMSTYPTNRARRGSYLDDTISDIDSIQVDSDYTVKDKLSNQK